MIDKWEDLVNLPYTNFIYCTQYSQIQYLWILFIKKKKNFYQILIHVNLLVRYIES